METDKKIPWVFWFPMAFVVYLLIRDQIEGEPRESFIIPNYQQEREKLYQEFASIVREFDGNEDDIVFSANSRSSISFYILFDKSITTNHDLLLNHGWIYAGRHIDSFNKVFCKNDVTLGFTSDSGIFLSYSKTDFCYDKVIVNGKLYEKVEQE